MQTVTPSREGLSRLTLSGHPHVTVCVSTLVKCIVIKTSFSRKIKNLTLCSWVRERHLNLSAVLHTVSAEKARKMSINQQPVQTKQLHLLCTMILTNIDTHTIKKIHTNLPPLWTFWKLSVDGTSCVRQVSKSGLFKLTLSTVPYHCMHCHQATQLPAL